MLFDTTQIDYEYAAEYVQKRDENYTKLFSRYLSCHRPSTQTTSIFCVAKSLVSMAFVHKYLAPSSIIMSVVDGKRDKLDTHSSQQKSDRTSENQQQEKYLKHIDFLLIFTSNRVEMIDVIGWRMLQLIFCFSHWTDADEIASNHIKSLEKIYLPITVLIFAIADKSLPFTRQLRNCVNDTKAPHNRKKSLIFSRLATSSPPTDEIHQATHQSALNRDNFS